MRASDINTLLERIELLAGQNAELRMERTFLKKAIEDDKRAQTQAQLTECNDRVHRAQLEGRNSALGELAAVRKQLDDERANHRELRTIDRKYAELADLAMPLAATVARSKLGPTHKKRARAIVTLIGNFVP